MKKYFAFIVLIAFTILPVTADDDEKTVFNPQVKNYAGANFEDVDFSGKNLSG